MECFDGANDGDKETDSSVVGKQGRVWQNIFDYLRRRPSEEAEAWLINGCVLLITYCHRPA
jgi:hypothetical protein